MSDSETVAVAEPTAECGDPASETQDDPAGETDDAADSESEAPAIEEDVVREKLRIDGICGVY
jgi:mycofactocin precursor